MKTSLSVHRTQSSRKGHILVLLAIMLPVLIGMVGLVVDGGLVLASYERSQNIADATARSVAIALHQGASHESLQGIGETFAFTHNNLPEDTELSAQEQVIVHHPPVSGAYAGAEGYVEVLITHPMDTNFIHVLGAETHQQVRARAVAGFREIPREAGVVILDPRANPGLSVSGTNAVLDVDSSVVVFTRRQGENEYGATVGEYGAGQPSVTVGGSGTTLRATELIVSGGVDDAANYIAPNVDALHAGTYDPPDDPFHDHPDTRLPIPTVANGVINRDLGSVRITAGNPGKLTSPNTFDAATGVTTLYPGIYRELNISGGTVVLREGIYVLQSRSGGGNVLSITGGTVTGTGVMFYNTGAGWDPVTGGVDVADLAASSETPPSGVQNQKFGGLSLNGSGIAFSPIDTDNPALDYSSMEGISVFEDMSIYQRRFNGEAIKITDCPSFPGGITGQIYAKWAPLQLSGHGTYNFSIVVGSMSVSGRAVVTVRNRLPIVPRIEPVRLVE